ncbi:MAG TPA: oxidoreductase [Steroidobacteraceae bacterium]|nr:oxidoreductase [Steroidobacteraceae bacterium]
MQSFKAFRIHEETVSGKARISAGFEQLSLDALSAGDVVVRVAWSDINYKDALAATGAGRILRRYPLVGGVDLSGTVVESADARYKEGDRVLVTGCGLSETRDGGYAEYARVDGDDVVPLPPGITLRSAMALGTAGFTAALAIHRMEHNGQTPQLGPIVVTGATGGVGSIAIDMLARRGYEVVAVTSKADAADYLHALGAHSILLRGEIDTGGKPLERARWGGAIDNVGGDLLGWLTRCTDNQGNIASIGLAGGATFTTSVMPFILRGVNLLGINSSATPYPTRIAVWRRIATDLMPRHLDRIVTRVVKFDALPGAFPVYLQNANTGRSLVEIGGDAA